MEIDSLDGAGVDGILLHEGTCGKVEDEDGARGGPYGNQGGVEGPVLGCEWGTHADGSWGR